MPLLSVEQYSDVINKRDPLSLSTLTRYDFLFKENEFKKEYCVCKGESSAIFKAVKGSKSFAMRSFLKGEPETKVVKGFKTFAIRCFLKPDPETFNRYQQIANFLATKELPWKIPFEFLDNEVLIDDQYYPVLKMDWEDGIPLNHFIDNNTGNATQLTKLQKKLVALSENLEEDGIGHGNLEYSNILLTDGQDFSLKLIDYDSMFIPAFKGEKSLETGNRGFQPPARTPLHFSETIDRFSFWVLLATLEAVKVSADAWQHMQQGGYNKEHSFFSASDFSNPEISPHFQKLRAYNSEALNFYLDALITFSRTSNLDTIERPVLHKPSFVSSTHEIPKPTPVAPEIVVEKPKQFEMEIKTIPSGKDVFVNGAKKGITPLRLSLLKKDFDHVEVLNDSEKTLIPISEKKSIYEIDFSRKEKENLPPAPPVEQDEILEFRADKYNIKEGELTTINWNVKGDSKIHISNLGDVAEKRGTQKVVLNHTTNYVLTVGSKNRSLTINVQPKPVVIQPAIAVQEKPVTIAVEEEKSLAPAVEIKRSSKSAPLKIIIGLAVLVIASFFAFNYFSGKKSNLVVNNIATNAKPAERPLFAASAVASFLNGLYKAYNNRNLNAIMSNYAGTVNEYYDSRKVSKDSLSTIIKNLFITPSYYNCAPDFKTLAIQPQENNCKAVITIHEKLRNNGSSKTESYTTTIEYLLDPSYKIISEKSVE